MAGLGPPPPDPGQDWHLMMSCQLPEVTCSQGMVGVGWGCTQSWALSPEAPGPTVSPPRPSTQLVEYQTLGWMGATVGDSSGWATLCV